MDRIFKTGKKDTYFEGTFKLRDENVNWATPIDFPTVFTAYGAAIKSGNWQSCTGINTPQYVIDHYFDGKQTGLRSFWKKVFALENITWEQVREDKNSILNLIDAANKELFKLSEL